MVSVVVGEDGTWPHELICRELGLAERPGARLLDGLRVGIAGIHGAARFDVSAVGITTCETQADSPPPARSPRPPGHHHRSSRLLSRCGS